MNQPERIGQYRVLGKVGRGSAATVYEVEDGEGHILALKLLREPPSHPEHASRFTTEAETLMNLDSPHVVKVLAYSHDDTGQPFLVMERGEDLRALLAKRGPLEPARAVTIIIDVLSGLEDVHQAGHVHRDVKPENVLLFEGSVAKLGDFGLARIARERHTRPGTVLGTPAYMSPEQAKGLDVDHRGDVFSAAVVLLELLTGKNPLLGLAAEEAQKLAQAGQVDLTSLPAALRRTPLVDCLTKALAKVPADRYQSAKAFADALKDAFQRATELLAQEEVPTPVAGSVVEVNGGTRPGSARISVVIASSPSGTSRAEALRRIQRTLGTRVAVSVVDFEQECLLPTLRDARGEQALRPLLGLTAAQMTLEQAVADLPADAICHYWLTALDRAVTLLLRSDGSVRVLSMHLTYYRPQHFEFYSPVNMAELLQRLQPSRVITFIDDVYDMYVRLASEGRIFDIGSLVRHEYERRRREGRRLPKSPGKRYLLALGQVVKTLLRLLLWRDKEVLVGQLLAASSGCEHKILAMKNPLVTGAALVAGARLASRDVYLSHPIVEVRSQRNKKGRWPDFVKELHGFIDVVQGVVPEVAFVMPTAIDEYRILHSGERGDADLLTPVLGERWPLHGSDQRWPEVQRVDNLLYSLPTDVTDYAEYEHKLIRAIFNPPIDSKGQARLWRQVSQKSWQQLAPAVKREVSGLLRGFTLAVTQQLAERDLALVRQSSGVLLYRPLSQKGEWSRGVTAEVSGWSEIVRRGISGAVPVERRRIVFIHSRRDVGVVDAGAFEDKQVAEAVFQKACKLIPGLHERLKERFGRASYREKGWFDSVLRDPSSHMDAGDLIPSEEKKLVSIRRVLEEEARRFIEESLNAARSLDAARVRANKTTVVSDHPEKPQRIARTKRQAYWSNLATSRLKPALGLASGSDPGGA